jgi:hypothetical protein
MSCRARTLVPVSGFVYSSISGVPLYTSDFDSLHVHGGYGCAVNCFCLAAFVLNSGPYRCVLTGLSALSALSNTDTSLSAWARASTLFASILVTQSKKRLLQLSFVSKFGTKQWSVSRKNRQNNRCAHWVSLSSATEGRRNQPGTIILSRCSA